MRILIVEDDPDIANCIKSALESEGFAVDITADGEEGSQLARTNDYDLVILDQVLPSRSGLDICRDIRAAKKTCYILALSVVSSVDKKVSVLDAGADDYLTKPFSLSELRARIYALLRRLPTLTSETLTSDGLSLETRRHVVHYRSKELKLTRKEFALLEYLLRNKGSVLTRALIMEHVWDMNADPFSNTIEAHILALRKKLSAAGAQDMIQTVSGVGYKLVDA